MAKNKIEWQECEGGGPPHMSATRGVASYRKTFRKVFRRIPYGYVITHKSIVSCGIDAPFGFIPFRKIKERTL